MADDRCIHEMIREHCSTCSPRPGQVDLHTGKSGIGNTADAALKQDSLTALCGKLGIAKPQIGVGSSVPSEVFDAMVERHGVPAGSMPDVGRAIANKAGVPWDEACESTGSTVTGIGLERLVASLKCLP